MLRDTGEAALREARLASGGWHASGEAGAAEENSYRVGLSTEKDLANLCSGLGSSRGDGRGEPEEEKRKATAEAAEERGFRLMGLPDGGRTTVAAAAAAAAATVEAEAVGL